MNNQHTPCASSAPLCGVELQASPAVGAFRDYALSRLFESAGSRLRAISGLLFGTDASADEPLRLLPRIPTRSSTTAPSLEQVDRVQFVLNLERHIEAKGLAVVKFDGFVIPSKSPTVTRLFYCREFARSDSYLNALGFTGPDRRVEAYALSRLLFTEVSATNAVHLSRVLNAPVDIVFSPGGYPDNSVAAQAPELIVVADVFGSAQTRLMALEQFRDHLKSVGKRVSVKPLTLACTQLERYLSNEKQGGSPGRDGQYYKVNFPGDLDGALLRPDGSVAAIIEYKSDTIGASLSKEDLENYSADRTRLAVLDDLCLAANAPLEVVFWSDKHTNAKLVTRDPRTATQSSIELTANSRDQLALALAEKLTGKYR